MRSKEFSEGWDYYQAAEEPRLSDNPYPDGSAKFYDWWDGFVTAENE